MDQFQLFFHNHPAGPVRESWQDAAQDAVVAVLARWVHETPQQAIKWTAGSEALIARMTYSRMFSPREMEALAD